MEQPASTPPSARRASDFGQALSGPKRLLLLLINAWPLVHGVSTVAVACWPWAQAGARLGCAAAVLFLLPPLLARLVRAVSPIRQSRVAVGSPAFFSWWTLFSLQVLFCRLPFLEELLRLVPGVYSLWLRLWGSRIGRLTYWAAGTRILDRSYLQIGDDVILGAGVRLNPHVLTRGPQGELELILAPIAIGDRAMIGGYSLLTAGTTIAPGECTRTMLLSPPFSSWANGTRTKGAAHSA